MKGNGFIIEKLDDFRSGGVMMAATSMIMRNECTSKVYNKYYRGAFCIISEYSLY